MKSDFFSSYFFSLKCFIVLVFDYCWVKAGRGIQPQNPSHTNETRLGKRERPILAIKTAS